MKKFIGIILVGAIVALSATAIYSFFKPSPPKIDGKTIKPNLVLNQIKMITPNEKDGDELYLTLSVRSAERATEYFRIPEKPDHWLSRQMDLVKDVSLWSEPIADGQFVTLIIELNEQDALPLNPDDLLGVLKVKIKNENGVLKYDWSIPNQTGGDSAEKHAEQSADDLKETGAMERFDIKNEGAHYELYLSLK